MLKQRHSFTVGEARDLIYIRDLLKILRNFGRPLDTPSKTEPLNLNPRLRRSFSAPCSSKFAARVLLKRCREGLTQNSGSLPCRTYLRTVKPGARALGTAVCDATLKEYVRQLR